MADRNQLIAALRQADAAGNHDDARRIAAMIQQAPAKPAAPPHQSFGRDMLDSAAAVGGGLWRGIAPVVDSFAAGGEAVGDAVDAGLRGVGLGGLVTPKPRQPFRLADVPDRLGTPRMVGHGGEFAANVLGGMLIPGPKTIPARARFPVAAAPRAASPAADIVGQGSQHGIKVMRSDVRPPQTALGKWVRARAEQIPFAGTGGMRAQQQSQRIDAIKNLVTQFGGNAERTMLDDTTSATNAVAENLAATRGNRLGALTAQKRGVIEGLSGGVPVPKALSALQEQIAGLIRLNAPDVEPVIRKLQGWESAIQNQPLTNVEKLRGMMGKAFDGNDMASIRDLGQKATQAIYAPLREDMGAFIGNNAGPEAVAKWANANEHLAAMAGELKNTKFRNVLSNADATPEGVSKMLFSPNPSDVARLTGNLSPNGQAAARRAIMQRVYDGAISADGGLSAERFVANLKKMKPSIQGAFKGADRAQVQGLGRVLEATRRASEAGVMPNNGAQNAPMVMLAAAMHYLGAGATVVAGGGAGLLARAYENKPVRDALIAASAVKPGSGSEKAMLDRAAVAISAALQDDVARLANDNVPIRAAAGERPEDQRR